MDNIWYKRVGFYNNPFSIKPAAYHDNLSGVGSAVDDISYAILTKKLVFMEGDYGQGKTTILKKLINDFGGRKQVAYFSCNRLDNRLDIQRLLKKRYGFLGNLFNLEAKDMILLLDEAQHLGEEDYKKLAEHHKAGSLKSVVFVTPKINGSANKLLQNALVVNLKKINQTEAVNIIRQRVGQLHLLSDDIINRIFERSDMNVRELLKNCEKVCKHAVDNEMTKVTEEILDEVLAAGNNGAGKIAEIRTAKRVAKKVPARKKALKEEKKSPQKEEQEDIIKLAEELKAPKEQEEDEIDKQVKQMAMMPDDTDDAEEILPKRKKKPVADTASKMDTEDLLNEEDYY